jgi:peroxiredoxin
VAKLADLAGARTAAADLGVPPRFARAAGVLVPALELAIAAALMPLPSARFGALAAALVLVVFTAAIGRALADGRAPDCHCFGQLQSAPAGPSTLARNIGLLALALFVAIAGWNGSGARPSAPWLLAIGAGILLAAETTVLVRLRARVSELEAGIHEPTPDLGLPVGAPAPAFELTGVDGARYSLRSLGQAGGDRILLVFVDARCAPCDLLMPVLAQWQERLRIAVIASGDPERNRAKAAEHGLALLLLQREREVSESYRAHGTPMAVLIDGGRIASPTVAGAKPIAQLANEAARALAPAPGDPAPTLTLQSQEGEPVSLEKIYDERTLLIFWSPGCEHSQKLVPGLRVLADERPPGMPAIVVISDGAPQEEIGATILLDPERQAMRAFGARGTPMALLISDGRIASPLVAGPAPVFDLLGSAAVAAR